MLKTKGISLVCQARKALTFFHQPLLLKTPWLTSNLFFRIFDLPLNIHSRYFEKYGQMEKYDGLTKREEEKP